MVNIARQPEYVPIHVPDESEQIETSSALEGVLDVISKDNADIIVDQSTAKSIISQISSEEFSFDPDAPPIWELAGKISAQIPDEEWQKLPPDLAQKFDAYQQQRQEQG